jgi:hypothetical protein
MTKLSATTARTLIVLPRILRKMLAKSNPNSWEHRRVASATPADRVASATPAQITTPPIFLVISSMASSPNGVFFFLDAA